jgi:hypothetical protein
MKTKSKKNFYDSATASILSQITNFGLSNTNKDKAIHFIKLFRELFKYNEIKQYMFITPESRIWNLGYDSAGFCRIASVSFAVIMGVKDWQLMCINDNLWLGQASHHYLQHIPTGNFLDITYDQFAFYGKEIPYELGHSTAFNLSRGDMSWKFMTDVLNLDVISVLKGEIKEL